VITNKATTALKNLSVMAETLAIIALEELDVAAAHSCENRLAMNS
jgi:hypothetical protein